MKGFRGKSTCMCGIGQEKGSAAYSFIGFAIIVIVIVATLLYFPWEQIGAAKKDDNFQRALSAMENKEWQRAVSLFDKSLETNSRNAKAFLGKSRAYQYLGNMDQALQAAEKAVELNSSEALAYGQRGIVEKLNGKADEALKDFQRAVQLNPEYAWAHAQIADLLSQKSDLDKALTSANKALMLRTDFPEVLRLRAKILTDLGKCKEAFADFSKVEQLRPNDAWTLQDKAWFLLTCPDESVQDTSKAMELAKKALDISKGDNGLVQETLAEAYFRKGNYPLAVEHQKKAIELQKKTCPDGSCVKEMEQRLKKYEMAAREETRPHVDILPQDSTY